MLELFVNGVADALADTFAGDPAGGPVAVLDAPRLARALRDRGVAAVAVGPWSRALRRAAGEAVCAGETLPFADGSLAAAVYVAADGGRDLADVSRVVRARGTLAVVTRDDPARVTTAALNAGLLELEQRAAGRAVVVTGRVLGPL